MRTKSDCASVYPPKIAGKVCEKVVVTTAIFARFLGENGLFRVGHFSGIPSGTGFGGRVE
jgi:hypothetical protein